MAPKKGTENASQTRSLELCCVKGLPTPSLKSDGKRSLVMSTKKPTKKAIKKANPLMCDP